MEDIREFAWAIGLDSNMHAIYIDLLSIGDITHTVIPSWSVYRGSYHYAASSIVIVHNHPSGNPAPSDSDITFTKEVITGGLFLGRPLVDHIILGDEQYYSFNDDPGDHGFSSLLKAIKVEEQGVKVLAKQLSEVAQKLSEVGEEKQKIDTMNGRLLDEIDDKDRALHNKDQALHHKDREIEKLKALLKRQEGR